MTAFLLGIVFATAGVLAVASMLASWHGHSRAALALRAELAACPAYRDFDVTMTTITVRADATVLRPDFEG